MSSDTVTSRLAAYRARFAADPGSGVFIALADMLRAAGEYDEALTVLGQGLAERPDSLSGSVVMGRTLLEAGREKEARTVLAMALQRDPDNTLALRLMAEVCRAGADWPAAVPLLERLVELEPTEGRWRSALAEALAQREAPTAGPAGTAASFATMTLVDIYVAQGYHNRALAALRQMLEADPERAEVHARIEELESEGAAEPSSASPPTASPGGSPEESPPEPPPEPRPARDLQKEQFSRWLEQASRTGEKEP